MNRERTRRAAKERHRIELESKERNINRHIVSQARRTEEWDDDEEDRLGQHGYYEDRSQWLRKRAIDREREEREDAADVQAELKEQAEEERRAAQARGAADNFLDQTASELATRANNQPSNVKISLGSAAARVAPTAATAPRRAIADVERLLEDEEDAASAGLKRPELKPITDTSNVPMSGQDLDDDERAAARQALAAEIPTQSDALFAHPIQWAHVLTPAILNQQIRPFVEKKVLEYLGVQEEVLVEAVMEALKEKKAAKQIVGDLEPALEDESEVLVRKVWRLLVFWGESGSRGLM